jgi:PBP1b-binding outer membrane lipoprotein LpoB
MKIKEEGWVRQFLKVNAAMALAVLTGCVSAPITEPAVQIHPDVEPLSTGIQSADVRTLASKLCPEILASSIVTEATGPVVIKVAPFTNTTRFFIDSSLFMSRLRLELNQLGGGKVRFQSDNVRVKKASHQVLRKRQEEKVRAYLKELAQRIAAHPQFVNKDGSPVKMAVAPVLGVNIVNMNGDSFAAMLRSEIAMASKGRIQFLMPGVMDGADYWLAGQFIPETMQKEGVINLANYIDIIDERVRLGKPLDTASIIAEGNASYNGSATAVGATAQSGMSTVVYEKERILSSMLHNPSFRENPDVNKHLSMMIVRPKDKLAVFEDMFLLDQKTPDVSGRANYVMSGEIKGMSQRRDGTSSDYLLISVQLTDPETEEIVYEGAHEVKRLTRTGVVYR